MPVPDVVPDKEPSVALRRERAVADIRANLVDAMSRINKYMEDHDKDDAIKKFHFAPTDIESSNGATERLRYYSLWDSSGLRILETGQLARAERIEPRYADIIENGADKSIIVTMRDLETDHDSYSLTRLADIAFRLERTLAPVLRQESDK